MIKIPRKQSDIKVKTYLEYEFFLNALTEEQKNDELYLLKNTVMIFYNLTNEQYEELPYNVNLDLYKIIENIFKMEKKLVPIFNLKGKQYGINPDFNDMTFAELVDCDTEDIIRQIAILYRPIIKKRGKKYRIEKYKADITNYELLKENLTLDIYYGFVGFFLRIQKDFINYTLKSLRELDINPEQKKTLEENGAGLVGFMNYVMVISPIRTLSLK